MLVVWLLVAALVGGVMLYLIARVSAAIRLWREPKTRWVRRAQVDRRRRQVPVSVERRAGPRRQEEVAMEYLEAVGTGRMRMVVANRA